MLGKLRTIVRRRRAMAKAERYWRRRSCTHTVGTWAATSADSSCALGSLVVSLQQGLEWSSDSLEARNRKVRAPPAWGGGWCRWM